MYEINLLSGIDYEVSYTRKFYTGISLSLCMDPYARQVCVCV